MNTQKKSPVKPLRRQFSQFSAATRHYSSLPLDKAEAVTRYLDAYSSATLPEAARPGTRFLRTCPFIYFRMKEIDRRVWLTLIFTNNPGRGFGRMGLSWLCCLADDLGVTLYLIVGRPERLGPEFLSNEALKAWYLRYGFREWGREMEKPVLVRPPKHRH